MRNVDPATPIVIRLFEPISLLFPESAMPSLRATVSPPSCILCEGPASPPARMGWLETPDRQAVFVVCGSCSDCDDAELERKITACIHPETAFVAAPAEDNPAPSATAWTTQAAREWARPATAQPAL
jgi:hypothetical protein